MKVVEEEAKDLSPTDESFPFFSRARFDALASSGNKKGAFAFASHVYELEGVDQLLLNNLAWKIVTSPFVKNPDLELAEKLAIKASSLFKDSDPYTLDTLARIQFRLGRKDQAIATQTRVVELADDEDKEKFRATLGNYKRGELPAVQPTP